MQETVKIIKFQPASRHTHFDQAAAILVRSFKDHWPEAWPDLEDAREEIVDMLSGENNILLAAVTREDRVIGWIGGLPEYNGNVWELHPLAVDPAYQGKGIGRALVAAFEEQVKTRGGLTVILGTDDEDQSTSLSGVDLYQETFKNIMEIKNYKGHPYSFYQKLGYQIVGVIPDANGPGKPDILMAKRLFKWD